MATNNSWNNTISESGTNSTLNGGTVSIGTDNAANAITIGTGTTGRTINIGRSAAAHTIVFGNTNTTTSVDIASGTGNMILNSAGTNTLTGTGGVTIQSTNNAITITSGTGTLGISTDASATTVNIATGAAVKGVTLGSTNSTSATTVQSGSGALTLTTNGGNANIVLTPNGTGVVTTANNLRAASVSFDGGTNRLANFVDVTAWTPVLQFGGASVGITYTAQLGFYSRIGNTVTMSVQMVLSNKGSSTGNATITGMPALNPTVVYLVNVINGAGLTYTNTLAPYLSGSSVINIGTFSTAGLANLTETAFANTSALYLNCTYLIGG